MKWSMGAVLGGGLVTVVLAGRSEAQPPSGARRSNCAPLTLDLAVGTVSGLAPTATPAEVERLLPCFSTRSADGLVFSDYDLSFHTSRQFIEVGPRFRGSITPVIAWHDAASLTRAFGRPTGVLAARGLTYWFWRRGGGCTAAAVWEAVVRQVFIARGSCNQLAAAMELTPPS